MSKLLKSFTDDVSTFLGIISDINQIMKNSKKDCSYTIFKGISYAYKDTMEDLGHNKLNIQYESNRSKKKKYNEDILLINGFIENGKELFSWISEFKKNVTKIDLYDDYFCIHTSVVDIFYKSKELNKDSFKKDINSFKGYLKRIREKNDNTLIYKDEEFQNTISKIENNIVPYECTFKTKSYGNIHFRMTSRIFLSLKKDSSVIFKITNVDSDNNVFGIDYEIINKDTTLKTYMTIINY